MNEGFDEYIAISDRYVCMDCGSPMYCKFEVYRLENGYEQILNVEPITCSNKYCENHNPKLLEGE